MSLVLFFWVTNVYSVTHLGALISILVFLYLVNYSLKTYSAALRSPIHRIIHRKIFKFIISEISNCGGLRLPHPLFGLPKPDCYYSRFETLGGHNFCINQSNFLFFFQKLFLMAQIRSVSNFRSFGQNYFFAP